MFSRVRIAIRFFFVGLAVGVLLAPRSGEQTRRMLREKADGLLNSILDAASLGEGAAETPEPARSRGANGASTRSRVRKAPEAAAESAETAEAGV